MSRKMVSLWLRSSSFRSPRSGPRLHLIAGVRDVGDLFRPFDLFFKTLLVLNPGAVAALGGFQNLFTDEDGAIDAQGQGYGVARPGVDQDQLTFAHYFNHGVEGVLAEFGHHHAPQ